MEVRIRLQKAGHSAQKHFNYRIVAISRSQARQSRHLELLGYYDPAKKPAVVSLDHAKLEKWLKNGAQMSNTVKSLVKKTKKS